MESCESDNERQVVAPQMAMANASFVIHSAVPTPVLSICTRQGLSENMGS